MLPGEYRGATDYCQPGATSPDSYASHDELHAVAGVELLHDARHVGLRGERREEEPLRDLVVREALADQAQHLGLALGQGLRGSVGSAASRMPSGRALEQPTGHAGREERVAAGDHADGADEVDRLGVLHEEPARAGADRAGDVLVELERRDDHDAHAARSAGSAAICSVVQRPSPSGIRMSRSATSTGVSRSARSSCFAAGCLDDDLDVGLRVQQRAEAGADELVVVGERDADHDAPAHGQARGDDRCRRAPRERGSGRRPRVRRARACRGCRRPRSRRARARCRRPRP